MKKNKPRERYVLGFLFSANSNHLSLALILKQKPRWMKDKWNGIGGKIEDNETALQAMRREFIEETGVDKPIAWQQFAALTGTNNDGTEFICYVYKAFDDCVFRCKTTEAEAVQVNTVEIWMAPNYFNLLSNLRWLIPLAMCDETVRAKYK